MTSMNVIPCLSLASLKRCVTTLLCLLPLMTTGATSVVHANALLDLPAAATSSIPAPKPDASSWILIDNDSGWVLTSHEPDTRIEPASISKLMTAYIAFDQIKKNALSLQTPVLISTKAWKTEGSRMFAEVNSSVSVEDLLRGLIIQSGNDAAVALAEHIAGSEEGFAELMNQTSARLGLTASKYQNSTGLPHPEHYSTARDIAILTRALIKDFPEFYKYYSEPEFLYNKISQKNRNVLLLRDDSVDGVKTGYTKAAGYCLVGSAMRDQQRFVAVVMGTKSRKARAAAVHSLLKYAFAAYESVRLYGPGEKAADAAVFFGGDAKVPVGADRGLYVTVPRQKAGQLKGKIALDDSAKAPVAVHDQLGTLDVTLGADVIASYPLVALQSLEQAGLWTRMVDTVRLWFN